MSGTFSEQDIESLLSEYLKEHPDAVERMHFVMQHPYRDNYEIMDRNTREFRRVAERMAFFQEYIARNPYDPSILLNNPPPMFLLEMDFVNYVAALLGPIGSYEIFD